MYVSTLTIFKVSKRAKTNPKCGTRMELYSTQLFDKISNSFAGPFSLGLTEENYFLSAVKHIAE